MENNPGDEARIKKEAESLTGERIAVLVEDLASADDTVRYPAFLVLAERSLLRKDVYPYFEDFFKKLKSGNAFQRSIGLAMLARNARWDAAGKLDIMLDEYLACLKDEKPMVVRHCIQNMKWIVPYKIELCKRIAETLVAVRIEAQKETQRKLVLGDILRILKAIRSVCPHPAIDAYFKEAKKSGLLDKKMQKELLG